MSLPKLDEVMFDVPPPVSSRPKENAKRRGNHDSKKIIIMKRACEILGFDYKDLTLKTKEELYDQKKPREINDLVYSHYYKRYSERMAQVEKKTMEIMSQNRDDRLKLNQFGYQGTPNGRSKSNSISSALKQYTHSEAAESRKSPRGADSGMQVLNLEEDDELLEISQRSPNEPELSVLGSVQKKLVKIQRQYGREMRQLKNMGLEQPDPDDLNQALQFQVRKFNKNLEKADKFAQNILDSDQHQQALRQEIQEREEKKRQIREKIEKDRLDAIQKKREIFQNKMEEIKLQKREFNKKLRQNAVRINKKFEEHHTRLIIREDNKKQMMRSHSESFIYKSQRAHEQKEFEYQEFCENTRREELKAQNYLEHLKKEQVLRKSESSKSLHDTLMRAQQKRDSLLEQQKSKFINKLCQKSENTETLKEYMHTTMTKKWQENTEKGKKQQENYKEVLKMKNKWAKGVIQSHRASQEHLNIHGEEKQKTILLKREMNNLKMLDKTENFAQIKRIQESRHNEILEKERARALKLNMIKEQHDVLAKAKIEVERKVRLKIGQMMDATINKVSRLKSAIPLPPQNPETEEL